MDHHMQPRRPSSVLLTFKAVATRKMGEEEANNWAEEEEEVEEGEGEEDGGEPFGESPLKRKRANLVSGSTGIRGTAATVGTGGGVTAPPAPAGCQADKCNADLTNSKRYHKRHKVCEYHAKAQVVMVAGQRQRFCQQCSRFHKLSEFDEAKRSCRRRLAGHNERRRKQFSESRVGEIRVCSGSQAEVKKNQCRSEYAEDPKPRLRKTSAGKLIKREEQEPQWSSLKPTKISISIETLQ